MNDMTAFGEFRFDELDALYRRAMRCRAVGDLARALADATLDAMADLCGATLDEPEGERAADDWASRQ